MKMLVFIFIVATSCVACMDLDLPGVSLSPDSFTPIKRGFTSAPGRTRHLSNITVRFYTTSVTSPKAFGIDDFVDILNDTDFDVNRPTMIYYHGYVELYTDESMVTMMSAYLQKGGFNVLLLDWSNLAYGNYLVVIESLPDAGKYVCESFLKLVQRGLPVDILHMVSHSLGCHFAGYVARCLKSKGYQVKRLTILDPAFPGFYPPLFALPVSQTDAAFVDAVGTTCGTYGTPFSSAQSNFWPNGCPLKQPGCPLITVPITTESFCSHWRSWRFYAESVNNEDAFLARQCKDYNTFLRGGCRNKTLVRMGFGATPNATGNFYLTTASRYPFGLGKSGAS